MSQMLSSDAMPTLSLTLSTTTKGDQVLLLLQPWKPRLREGQRPAQGRTVEGPELWQTQNPHSSFCRVPLLWSISSSVITLFTSSGKSNQKLRWAYGVLWFFVFTFIMKTFKYIQNRDEYNETPSLHLPVPTMISLHPTLILCPPRNPELAVLHNPAGSLMHSSRCLFAVCLFFSLLYPILLKLFSCSELPLVLNREAHEIFKKAAFKSK